MTWVRIDDGFAEHTKVHGLSDRAFRLHVHALCYCGRNLTDGDLQPPALRMLMGSCSATRRHVAELVAAGVWDDDEDGCRIHDFTDLNPTAVEVRDKRRKRQDAGRRGGVAKALANASPVATPRGRAPDPARPENSPRAVDLVRGERPSDFVIPELRSVS